jgi:DNA-binding transcriptional MerR regulator
MTNGMRKGFNSTAVMRLTGLTHRQLVYLDAKGLVKPSIRPADGSGSRRVYSFEDLVELHSLAAMRRSGVSLQAVRGVVEHLRKRHRKPLASLRFSVQGRRIYIHTDNPKTVEELTASGQFTMVLPIEGIVRKLSEKVTQISAPHEFTVRAAHGVHRAVATPDLEVGGFSISFPSLPGCFSEADTLRKARSEAREAVEAYLGAGVVVGGARSRQAGR